MRRVSSTFFPFLLFCLSPFPHSPSSPFVYYSFVSSRRSLLLRAPSLPPYISFSLPPPQCNHAPSERALPRCYNPIHWPCFQTKQPAGIVHFAFRPRAMRVTIFAMTAKQASLLTDLIGALNAADLIKWMSRQDLPSCRLNLSERFNNCSTTHAHEISTRRSGKLISLLSRSWCAIWGVGSTSIGATFRLLLSIGLGK